MVDSSITEWRSLKNRSPMAGLRLPIAKHRSLAMERSPGRVCDPWLSFAGREPRFRVHQAAPGVTQTRRLRPGNRSKP